VFDARTYGGCDPDALSELGAKLRLEAYGWNGRNLRSWLWMLMLRTEGMRLLEDAYFLSALVRLVDPPRSKPATSENGPRNRGGGYGVADRTGSIRSNIERWQAIHSEPLRLAGDGNTLGVTAKTILRWLTANLATVSEFSAACGLPNDDRPLSNVMLGRRRIDQGVAEKIAAVIDPIPDDRTPNDSVPEEARTAAYGCVAITDLRMICDWYEVPFEAEAMYVVLSPFGLTRADVKIAIEKRRPAPAQRAIWDDIVELVRNGFVRDERRRAAESYEA
jgi:hypothetical protein